jgi:hypothetical protein
VGIRARAHPESDTPAFAELEIVDDECRVLRVVQIELELRTIDLETAMNPLSPHYVGVGLILGGRLFPKPVPRIVGKGDVLDAMIAA